MLDFMAKMHQIIFWLGLQCGPRYGSLERPQNPVVGFKGPTSKGRGGERRERRDPLYFFTDLRPWQRKILVLENKTYDVLALALISVSIALDGVRMPFRLSRTLCFCFIHGI